MQFHSLPWPSLMAKDYMSESLSQKSLAAWARCWHCGTGAARVACSFWRQRWLAALIRKSPPEIGSGQACEPREEHKQVAGCFEISLSLRLGIQPWHRPGEIVSPPGDSNEITNHGDQQSDPHWQQVASSHCAGYLGLIRK